MNQVIAWAGFLGAWLLVAGPLYRYPGLDWPLAHLRCGDGVPPETLTKR